ncbi:MAG: DUF5606 domain-containing protein [Paludibacteraceae bacterium]|nr:DUF5606 domain-containing protein [Paludibacteraceae bacterium]
MLKRILSISGQPGLFELIAQGNNSLIVEDVETKRRKPAHSNDKVISLADIAIFTEDEEVSLGSVFESIKKKENGAQVEINVKDAEELHKFFAAVLPNYDRVRVHNNDIKKVIRWYNLLTAAGKTEFVEESEAAPAAAEAKAEAAEAPAEGVEKKKRTRKKAEPKAE